MSAHPREWWTSTLLMRHGPRDRSEYDVMRAIDSLGNGAGIRYVSLVDLADAARMDPRYVKAAVKRLEVAGWLIVTRPTTYKRGTATGYTINRRLLEIAACEAIGTLAEEPVDNHQIEPHTAPLVIAGKGYQKVGSRGTKRPPLGSRDLKEGARAAAPPSPAPVDKSTAPPPCRRHPNGWRHGDNCRACAALRQHAESLTAPAPLPMPEWCTHCDVTDRTIPGTDALGRMVLTRCPRCHPKAHTLTSA